MNKTKALSYMLAVPEDPTDVANGVLHLARLKNAKDFTVNGLEEKAGELQLTIGYLGKEYLVRMIPTEFKIPELYRIQHFFPDEDVEKLKKAHEGLGVILEFGEDPLEAYHLQLKIVHAALPKKLAVFDDSAEKVLSGKWWRWQPRPRLLRHRAISTPLRQSPMRVERCGFTATD